MTNLFTVENKIEILEVKTVDILKKSEIYKSAFKLISKHEEKYPDIKNWFETKVLTDIKNNERVLYIGLNNNQPIASAVVKKGEDAKFCHLYIEKELRHQNIGDIFFLLMSIYIKRYSKSSFFITRRIMGGKEKFFQFLRL